MNRRNFLRAATAAISTTVASVSIAKAPELKPVEKLIEPPTDKPFVSYTNNIGGVERMRIGADGSVGIGTISPRTKLYVSQALD